MKPRILPRRTALALAASSGALAIALGGCSSDSGDDTVTLTLLADNSTSTLLAVHAVVDAFMAQHPDIAIEIDTRPQGSEGDNAVKSRLATGEMTDLFQYNTGSLMRALHPDATMLNLHGDPYIDDIAPFFLDTVSTAEGVYGVPFGTMLGGGVLYNIELYDELGLEIPTTWAEFMANSEAIAASGSAGVIQTFGDTWTSQMLVLGDFFHVVSADPNWVAEYTAGNRRYADMPARAGFDHLQEVYEAGVLNEDFATATYDDGLRMVATGEGAHYPMLTSAIPAMIETHPASADGVGFFALPGERASAGLTSWAPPAIYGSAVTEHPEEVRTFLAFVASVAGCDAQTDALGPAGPYLVEGCTIPVDVPRSVADILPYFNKEDGHLPALEFLSPVKGTALEQITVEVGSGIRDAASGAALYDQDVAKQAQQLGLEGW